MANDGNSSKKANWNEKLDLNMIACFKVLAADVLIPA
jgi:hypothetical protein